MKRQPGEKLVCVGRLLVSNLLVNALVALVFCTTAMTQVPALSTHDWKMNVPTSFKEVWADVKSPGDGRIYSVGTIEVQETLDSDPNLPPVPGFSGAPVQTPPPLLPLDLPIPGPPFPPNIKVQIAILQVSNADGSIRWQRYFHGDTPSFATLNHLSTNARAVSVWPVWNDATGSLDEFATRIAICGETFDKTLPLSQPGRLSQQPRMHRRAVTSLSSMGPAR